MAAITLVIRPSLPRRPALSQLQLCSLRGLSAGARAPILGASHGLG